VSKECAALTLALEAEGAIRASVIDAITGEVIAEHGAPPTAFSASLVSVLWQEIRGLEAIAATSSDGPSPLGTLRDIVLRFMNYYYILRPLPSGNGLTPPFIQLDLHSAIANIPAAQAQLAEAATRFALDTMAREETATEEAVPSIHAVDDNQDARGASLLTSALNGSNAAGLTQHENGVPPPYFLFDQELLELLDATKS
jgi:hypothetical protein